MLLGTGSPFLTALGQGAVAVLVGVIGWVLRRKVAEVHVLVNNRAEKQDKLIEEQGTKIERLEAALGEARKSPALEPASAPPPSKPFSGPESGGPG